MPEAMLPVRAGESNEVEGLRVEGQRSKADLRERFAVLAEAVGRA